MSDIDNLISELFGEHISSSEPVNSIKESGNYQWPVKVTISGKELEPNEKPKLIGTFLPDQYVNESHKAGHDGLDLQAPRNTPIYPIGPGEVIETKEYPKGGKTIKVSHEGGNVLSYYAHCEAVLAAVGDQVGLNTQIAAVGDSGNAAAMHTSTHCHLEVKVKNIKVDPQSVIGKPIGSFSKEASNRKESIFKISKDLFISDYRD